MQVSPLSVQLGELEPEKSYEGKIQVSNTGDESFEYEVYATPYSVTNEEYEPSFNNDTTATQIKDWFEFSDFEGTLGPKESKEISYKVTVPADAPAGGQYAAVMVESKKNRGKEIVEATARVAVLLYSHVNGETNKCGTIEDININTFVVDSKISATSLVENCGNVDLEAVYKMQVSDLFGNILFENQSELESKTLLPDSRRRNTVVWDGSPSVGIFNVELSVELNGESKTVKKIVIVTPLWVIFVVLGVVGLDVFWLVFSSKRKNAKKTLQV